jgi:hypothetical protein
MSIIDQRPPNFVSLINANVLGRALVVAAGLGGILTLINQPDAIFGTNPIQVLPLILVFVTPFVVVTISQVLGVHRAILDLQSGRALASYDGMFFATAMSHGIPLRALLVAMVTGTISTSIVALASLAASGTLSNIPVALTLQAFTLPLLFGLISQTISYRRAVTAVGPRIQSTSQQLFT